MVEMAYRLSGISLIGGAALLATATVVLSIKPVANAPLSPGVSTLMLLSSILLLLSLPAVFARQAGTAGLSGLAGHGLLQTGVLLLVVLAAAPLLYPSTNFLLGENIIVFVLGIALTLGLLLTSVTLVRTGVFPRGAGILMLTATAGFFFVFFVAEFLPPIVGQVGNILFAILLTLSLSWLGISLLNSSMSSV